MSRTERNQRPKSELSHDTNPMILFDKFKCQYNNEINVQQNLSKKQRTEKHLKMKQLLSFYEKKMFPSQNQHELSNTSLSATTYKNMSPTKQQQDDPYELTK